MMTKDQKDQERISFGPRRAFTKIADLYQLADNLAMASRYTPATYQDFRRMEHDILLVTDTLTAYWKDADWLFPANIPNAGIPMWAEDMLRKLAGYYQPIFQSGGQNVPASATAFFQQFLVS